MIIIHSSFFNIYMYMKNIIVVYMYCMYVSIVFHVTFFDTEQNSRTLIFVETRRRCDKLDNILYKSVRTVVFA